MHASPRLPCHAFAAAEVEFKAAAVSHRVRRSGGHLRTAATTVVVKGATDTDHPGLDHLHHIS